MIAEITAPDHPVKAEILLPASKSISNRVLIIHALGNLQSAIHNLSNATDTLNLVDALRSGDILIDAGEGGTTTRFLLAYYCVSGTSVTLTASESMRKRPVTALVNALKFLGAKIDYLEEKGKLPVRITGSPLKSKTIVIDGDVSSQFISALMLTGPYIHGGITIEITGDLISLPYIKMTQSVMQYFGADVLFNGTTIKIAEGTYKEREITIEPDWSAASYWYEIAALSTRADISLPGLKKESLQGDSAISRMMQSFGVNTTFNEQGAILTKTVLQKMPDYFSDDFSGCPDLAPAVAGVCAGWNLTADLHGLKNFRLKESDRAAALQRELYNMNVKTDFCGGSKFKLYEGPGLKNYSKPLKTYNDHRIAMAFAPLALKAGVVEIENYEVVSKSYPGFFNDLQTAGFKVSYY